MFSRMSHIFARKERVCVGGGGWGEEQRLGGLREKTGERTGEKEEEWFPMNLNASTPPTLATSLQLSNWQGVARFVQSCSTAQLLGN